MFRQYLCFGKMHYHSNLTMHYKYRYYTFYKHIGQHPEEHEKYVSFSQSKYAADQETTHLSSCVKVTLWQL